MTEPSGIIRRMSNERADVAKVFARYNWLFEHGGGSLQEGTIGGALARAERVDRDLNLKPGTTLTIIGRRSTNGNVDSPLGRVISS